MIRILMRDAEGVLRTDLTPETLRPLRAPSSEASEEPLVWVDLHPEGEELPKIGSFLLNDFGFHPVAIEDALQEVHVPKLDDWEEYIYMVLHLDKLVGSARRLETHELDVFLGRRFLVTHHGDPSPVVDAAWEKVRADPALLERGVGYILHVLLDGMVEATSPLVDQFQDWVDEAEAEVLEAPTSETLESILGARRGLLRVRRNMRGTQQVVTRLSKEGLAVVSAEDRIYFRDVQDNVHRQMEGLEGTRELVAGAMDTYLSVTSNRTNEIMYTLTLLTALFLPISFLAGFFGMNFFGPEFLIHPGDIGGPVFMATMAVIVVLPPAMLIWMRWRGWL